MSDSLQVQKCKPCYGEVDKLNEIEINNNLKKIIHWKLDDNKEMIYKKFIFKSFKQSLNFTNLIGKIAEEEGHHPDISFGWGYCLVMIHTR